MSQRYIAIPLLVYVPDSHDFCGRGEEYIESSLCDHLRLIGLRPFIAEDFQNATVHLGDDQELSAHIGKVCKKPEGTEPGPRIKSFSPSNLHPDFNTYQSWEDFAGALDYCSRQDDPESALIAIVIANIQNGESGWAAGLLERRPDFWTKPEITVMEAAIPYLKGLDIPASYEHPGYLAIHKDGIDFAFGDLNGDYTFDYCADPANPGIRQPGGSTLKAHSSCMALAWWIHDQVRATCAAHKPAPAQAQAPSFQNMIPCPPEIAAEVLAIETAYQKTSVASDLPEPWLGYIANYATDSPGFHGELVYLIWPAEPACIDIYRRPAGSSKWEWDRNVAKC